MSSDDGLTDNLCKYQRVGAYGGLIYVFGCYQGRMEFKRPDGRLNTAPCDESKECYTSRDKKERAGHPTGYPRP